MRDPGGMEDAAYILALEERLRNQVVLEKIVDTIRTAQSEQASFVSRLESLGALLAQLPAELQQMINNCDVVEVHRRVGLAIETDLWSRLTDHTNTESERLKQFLLQIQSSVAHEVAQLRDAAAGKPDLPTAPPGSTLWKRLRVSAQRAALRIVRACAVLRPVATTCASITFTCAAVVWMLVGIDILLHDTLRHYLH